MILGCDVGLNGAIVGIDKGKIVVERVMPRNVAGFIDLPSLYDIFNIIEDECGRIPHAYIEDVHAFQGSAATATFNFGWSKGVLEAMCAACQIPYTLVNPRVWTKFCWQGVQPVLKTTPTKKGSFTTDTKKTSLIAAQRLFPGEKFAWNDLNGKEKFWHDGKIDGALIAYWGENHK